MQLGEHLHKQRFYLGFAQMRSFAAGLPLVLSVASPDHPAVLVGRVPYLRAVPAPALSAADFHRKRAETVLASALGFSFRHFRLHQLPFGFINYPRMAVRDDVLRNLALVFLHLFGKEIDREALLEHSVAAVLFIRQYALDGFILPPCFFPRSRNAGFCQYLRNGVDGFAAHEQPVNEPDCFRFFRVDLRQTIWAFSVSEKLSVGHIDLAVGEMLPLSPRHIVRYGAALFLRKR